MKFTLVSMFLCLSLIGCNEVKIKDGKIPAKYLDDASQFVGSYIGEFNQKNGTLRVTLKEDLLRLSFSSIDGNDLLDPQCQSQIGKLETINVKEISKDNYTLTGATFAYSAGNCSDEVIGKALHINIKKEESERMQLNLRILEYVKWVEDPSSDCHRPGRPSRSCQWISKDVYLKGQFTKN